MHQFYDTYREMPGRISNKTCKRHAIFRTSESPEKKYMGKNISDDWYCNLRTHQFRSKKLLQPVYQDGGMYELWRSGLIDNGYDDAKLVDYGAGCGNSCLASSPATGNLNQCTTYTDSGASRYGNWASFDAESFIQLVAPMSSVVSEFWMASCMHYASNIRFSTTYSHEYQNPNFLRVVDHHNLIVLARASHAKRYDSNGRLTGTQNDSVNTSALTAKISSELDAKIDDGRPGSGRLLAMKGGLAHVAGTSRNTYESICYDGASDNIHKSIYANSNNLKYGCNIIKVMEDVK